MAYRPPTRVSTTETPFLALITSADPGWARGKFREVEYEFQGKNFYANPYTRGSFNSHSGIYPVGQQFGGLDPLVVAARPMYSQTPTPPPTPPTPPDDSVEFLPFIPGIG